jgi:tetratricopeptide (TPR) repeat protein
VPASVQAILSARIDRLAQRDKLALQAAAVIGKEFPQPVLERVVDAEPSELEHSLRNLVAGEFVYEQEIFPEALYAFKHPLTQEVAYGSQLGERRGGVHAAVARAIVEQYPERLDERAALLAQHWEAAGDALEAMRWHARAAAWSGTNEQVQALRHWRRVRELADELPESEETLTLGVQARIALLNYGWRLGISREDAEVVFEEADRMAARAGDTRSRAMVLYIYGTVKGIGQGELHEYAVLFRQALALAEESGDADLYVGVASAAYSLFCIGEYRECVAACDRAIELANGDTTAGAGIGMGSPYAHCHGIRGIALGQLGETVEAHRATEQDRKLARDQGDIEVVGWTHQMSAQYAFEEGEPEAALAHAQQAFEIAERIGNSFSRAWSWLYLGMAKHMRGEWHRAIEALERSGEIAREGHTATESTGWRLALLGESHLGLGDSDRARALVTEGVEIAHAQAYPFGEIYARVALARVLLSSGDPADRAQAEATLASTLELVHEIGAKTYEPFVHVELAELARQRGDEERRERELREAHRLFTEVGASGHAERLSTELALPAS